MFESCPRNQVEKKFLPELLFLNKPYRAGMVEW